MLFCQQTFLSPYSFVYLPIHQFAFTQCFTEGNGVKLWPDGKLTKRPGTTGGADDICQHRFDSNSIFFAVGPTFLGGHTILQIDKHHNATEQMGLCTP
jgi:hypothetical protein